MKRKGFVIPLVLMLISIAMILVVNIFQRGSTFVPFATTMVQKQQAKELAISGVHIAMSQIAHAIDGKEDKKATPKSDASKEKEKENKKEISAEQEQKNMLQNLLPTLNQWQTFELTKDLDGLDGTIKISLSCEEGKMNLNTIYNFQQDRFIGENQSSGDWKKELELLAKKMQQKVKTKGNLFESFEKFFKHRQYKVNDASELLTQDGFRAYARLLFYEPPEKQIKEQPLYLFDLFTVYGKGKIQPWMLSASMRNLFDMQLVTPNDQKKKQSMIQDLLKKYKTSISVEKDWDTFFKPLYGIDFKRLPKGIEQFFATSFDPNIFSVVSYGKVGQITQRVYAILERIRHTDKNKTWYDVKIRKFYWI